MSFRWIVIQLLMIMSHVHGYVLVADPIERLMAFGGQLALFR